MYDGCNSILNILFLDLIIILWKYLSYYIYYDATNSKVLQLFIFSVLRILVRRLSLMFFF